MYDLVEEINSIRYDYDMYVLEAYDDYLTKNMLMITEAKAFNANNKSLISKIIDGFKKALNAVKKFISNIINKIKSLFKKNSDKNINNIAQDILSDSDTTVTESFYVEGVQKGTDYITAHGLTPEQFSDDIYLQILNNGVIRIHYRQGRQLNRPNIESSKDLKNANKFKSNRDDLIGDVIHMITHLDLLQDLYSKMSKFINVLNKTKESTPELDACHSELEKSFEQLDRAKNKVNLGLNPKVDLKVSDMLETQSLISKLTAESEKLNYNDYDPTWYSKYINILGNISHKFTKFQMCLNAFSNKLDFDINFIAPQYRGKIKDPSMLAKFVKGCIDKGISPKYLSYNTWLISSKKIKGDTKHFDPIKGQSRFVLFPEDSKIVYKVAMSGFGIASNNNEYKITNLVKDKPETKDYFALILNNYEDGVVVEQERVVNNLKDSGLSPEVRENSLNALYDKSQSTSDIEEDIGVIQRDLGIKTPISLDDLHSGNKNIDTNRGHIVLIDYGMLLSNFDISGVQRMSPERYSLLKEERRMYRDYKSGKIPKDEYESWKADADKKAWSMRNIEDLTDFEIVDRRNSLIEQIENETDPKKKHDLKKQIDKLQKELHMRDSLIDSHVYGATVTTSKESD